MGNSQSCQGGVETTIATGSRELDTTDQTLPAVLTEIDDHQPEIRAERFEIVCFVIVNFAKYYLVILS